VPPVIRTTLPANGLVKSVVPASGGNATNLPLIDLGLEAPEE